MDNGTMKLINFRAETKIFLRKAWKTAPNAPSVYSARMQVLFERQLTKRNQNGSSEEKFEMPDAIR